MPLLRDNLQPTDFADAVCKVTEWNQYTPDFAPDLKAYRIWICNCGNHWFSRHEWEYNGRNQTKMDDWLYSGFYRNKKMPDHATIDYRDLKEL